MPDGMLRESPLARFELPSRKGLAPTAAGIVFQERAFLGHINLRGDAGDPTFSSAIRTVLGVSLPLAPNTTCEAGGSTICWLGPDEWLVLTPGLHEKRIVDELRSALGSLYSAVTEVSGGQTMVVLRGACVRELLSKDCPLDLHLRTFPLGTCAQSRVAKAPVLLRPIEDGNTFEIVVQRSFADYFWLWLEDAAAEYGLAAA